MERPFGSSERVSKSDPFSSNNRLSISRTFPGTPPNNHILPFPDVCPDANVQLSPYPAQIRCSGALSLIRPKLEFPSISTLSPQMWKKQNKVKTTTSLSTIHDPSSLPPPPSSSRHSAGRSSALMTSRFLTIQITSAGARHKRLAIKETHGPSAMGNLSFIF